MTQFWGGYVDRMLLSQTFYVVTDPWGSVAEWVAGIGTFAAVSVSLYVVLGDRLKQKRSEADSFSTWSRVGHTTYSKGNEPQVSRWWIETNFYNAGGRPVPYISLSWWNGESWKRFMGTTQGMDPYIITPGAGGIVEAPMEGDVPLNWNCYFITMKDSSGATWYRSPQNNQYIAPRKMKRLEKRGPKPLRKTEP